MVRQPSIYRRGCFIKIKTGVTSLLFVHLRVFTQFRNTPSVFNGLYFAQQTYFCNQINVMKLLILATHDQQEEISVHLPPDHSDISFAETLPKNSDSYDAYFFLNQLPSPDFVSRVGNRIVFINEVIRTLDETGYAGHVIRINGWSGFLERKIWETAGSMTEQAGNAIRRLGRKFIPVKDVPGLVSGRVIASIINEACQAREEKVSSEENIDLALKLGTNYPYGPFEWCYKIGEEKIFELLSRMAESDNRYQPLFKPAKSSLTK